MLDRPRNMRRRMRLRLLLAGAVLPLALWAALPVFSEGASSPSSRLHDTPAQDPDHAGQDRPAQGHRAPADDADQRLLAAHRAPAEPHRHLQSQQSNAQADLDAKRNELFGIQRDLRAERRRLVRLRARLAQARVALAQRLVELYQADKPDIVTVIMSSKGFAELLERGEFMQRVSEQDQHIIKLVHDAKADATATARAWTSSRSASSAHRDRPAAPRRDRRAPSRASSTPRSGSTARARTRRARWAPCAPSASSWRATSPGSRPSSPRSRPRCSRRRAPAGRADQARQRQPDLAGQRPDHLAVLRAPGLGGLPPGHRHRRPLRHADPRRRRRQGGPDAVGRRLGRLRQLHLHPAHRRDVDVLRAPVALRHLAGRERQPGPGHRLLAAAPGCASARTCTSRCASTARSPTR